MAVKNLAGHSESVLAVHGSESRRSGALWLNDHAVQIPYSHVITLDEDAEEQAVSGQIEAFVQHRPSGAPVAVNDSFSNLDLSRLGMRRLFSDHWFVKPPGKAESVDVEGLEVTQVSTPDRLLEYDRACAIGFGEPDSYRIYLDELLADERHKIYVGRSDGRVVTGVLAFNNGQSVGLYSLFTLPDVRNRGFAEAVVRSAIADSDELPVSTNPSEMSNRLFKKLGFESIGQRTIWLRG